ncbi:MAG: crotonobetainyl-CoA:carnitine CoA-transferase CaiB-like acyl-CoA transferase [Candidatus Azotimanducaceae bacterium]|jgi:crotonobetainyl-CoA:carnitine CoA-transferase CaiB-like acyl-CoA transferase
MTALKGYRIVELSNERLSFAGKLLADMGAEVILVEPPGGDPTRQFPPFLDDEPGKDRSLYWWHYNTNKKSVVLDLESDEGRDSFQHLIQSADLLIESEPRARLGELGLDYEQLVLINEKLIHVAMTPFGRDDPKSDLPATDLTILAGGGPVWSCGYDDNSLPPVRGLGNQGYHTGCHFAVMSALTALLYREVSGEGQFIDVSMHAAANVTTEAGSYSWLVANETVQRQTGRHASIAPTMESQIRCADGRYANTGVPPRFPHEFKRLYDWLKQLGLEEELPEAVFLEMGANWEGPFDLSAIGKDDTLTAIFMSGRQALSLIGSKISAYDFFHGCQSAGLSVGVVNSPDEAYEDPHFKARGFQVEVEHENLDRTFRYPGAPYHFEKTPWQITKRAPMLAEHQEEIIGALTLL